jgi:hypothetical protein
MKTKRIVSILTVTAIAAALLAGTAQAGEGGANRDASWTTLAPASSGPLPPSYGTAITTLSADTTLKLTVNPDGSVTPASIAAARDEGLDLQVSNNSREPVRVSIEGEGAPAVAIGQVAAGEPGEFGWRFDSWNAQPRLIKIGQAAVKVYVHAPRSTN